jgi:hypothetical protein
MRSPRAGHSTQAPPPVGTLVRVHFIDPGLLATLQGEELSLVQSMVGCTFPVVAVSSSGYVVVEASLRSSQGYTLSQSVSLAPNEYVLASSEP